MNKNLIIDFYENLNKFIEQAIEEIHTNVKNKIENLDCFCNEKAKWNVKLIINDVEKCLKQLAEIYKNEERIIIIDKTFEKTILLLCETFDILLKKSKYDDFWFNLRKEYNFIMQEKEDELNHVLLGIFNIN